MTDLRAQLQSTLGDAYTIERELGGGGMSRVFLAYEPALKRKVVIKVLPSEAVGALSVERFKREIQFAATLQQANIVPVLNAGETNGVPFYTMPYVEGESLRARLAVDGAFAVPEAVGLLKEIARALSHAHSKNVVHRDIKPDNVLVSGGSAMVTDFGIAKALSDSTTAGGGTLTGTGTTLGTPAYMAPEQAGGEANIDHRADIYAFGCLAYEILTGAPPFSGPSPHAIIAAHLTKDPEPVEKKRERLPKALVSLVTRCLAKDPAARPQSAIELVYALDELSAPTPPNVPFSAARIRRGPLVAAAVFVVLGLVSLAVLPIMTGGSRLAASTIVVMPFSNTSGDTAIDYLAEGLSDEMRVMLTSQGLSVKARGSSMALAGRNVKEIGSKLGVATVLQGTLTRAADEPKVVAELVRVRDETVIWNGTFGVKSTAASLSRDSLVRNIALALRAHLVPSIGTPRSADRGTTSDAAYEAYLKGEYARRRFDLNGALPHLSRAIALDSSFARAHASIALAYALLPVVGGSLPSDVLPRANASAARALALDPSLSSARIAQGLLPMLGEFKSRQAEPMLRKAVELNPENTEARFWHAWSLGNTGRLPEAERVTEEAIRIDPLSPDVLVMRQVIHMTLFRFVEGAAATKAILEIDPNNGPAHWNAAEMYIFAGKADSAVPHAEKLFSLDSTAFGSRAVLMLTYAAAGRWKEARLHRARAEQMQQSSPNYFRTMGALAFGDFDAAAAALVRGLTAHEPLFNSIWPGCEPFFEPIRFRPSVVAALKSVEMEPCSVTTKWPIGPPKP
jgi:TolB-like protein